MRSLPKSSVTAGSTNTSIPRPARWEARLSIDSATCGSEDRHTSAIDLKAVLMGRVYLTAMGPRCTYPPMHSEATDELSERAQRLLKVLIESYIRDGQPVGSLTLSR